MDKEEKEIKLVLKEDNQYQMMQYDGVTAALFQAIREKLHLEPSLGECMFVKGKFYVTHPGCSRLAEQKEVKSIQYEYLDPEKFPMPQIRKNPDNFIIVKCILTKKEGGFVDGLRILDLTEERKIGFQFKCECGNESKYFQKTSDKWKKICPKCKKEIKGFDMWLIKDYVNFAETKAFMRAVGKAYSVEVFDDLPEDLQKEAKDVSQFQTEKELPKIKVEESKPEPVKNNQGEPVIPSAKFEKKPDPPKVNGNEKVKVWESFDGDTKTKILAAKVIVKRVTEKAVEFEKLGFFPKGWVNTTITEADIGKELGVGFKPKGIEKLKTELKEKIEFDENVSPPEDDEIEEIPLKWDEIVPKERHAEFLMDLEEAENLGFMGTRNEYAADWIKEHQ